MMSSSLFFFFVVAWRGLRFPVLVRYRVGERELDRMKGGHSPALANS